MTTTADGPGPCTPVECTLRGAVEAADEAGEASTITVPQGEYVLTAAEGESDLVVHGEITINGAGAGLVRIVQGANCECRVFFINGAPVTISGVTVAGGTVAGKGGDILNEPSGGGLLRLVGDVITAGSATGNGGGIYSEEGEVEILETTVSGNRAEDGGGLLIENDSGEPVTLERDTLVGNHASERGGGVFFEIAETFVTNSTFNGNRALDGGGIGISDVTLKLLNDTLAGDVAEEEGGGAEVYGGGADQIELFNTILGPAGEGLVGSECFSDAEVTASANDIDAGESCEVGSANGSMSNTDPQLEPLAANGGPTKTMAIAASSPANEAADPAACPATDQRGVSRPEPAGTSCDIGAFEFGTPAGGGGEEAKQLPSSPPSSKRPPTSCSTAGARATSFKPKVRPGHVVPGIRVRLSAGQPAELSVQARVIWKHGGNLRSAKLGRLHVKVNRWRRVRFAIPAGVRDELPVGTPVTVKVQIRSKSAGCGASSTGMTLHLHIVKVLPHAVQFERPLS